MYTTRRPNKKLPKLNEEPSLLGGAVAAAVRGHTTYLQELMIEYFRCNESKHMHELTELLLRALGQLHIKDEPTDEQNLIIKRASDELGRCHRQFRAAMIWLCSPKRSEPAPRISLKLLASGKWRPGRFPSIDKRSERHIRFFETHGLRHLTIHLSLQQDRLVPFPGTEHLVDFFCAYLLDRCLNRKVSEMPIKICPSCGKVILSTRKQFCSRECQWKSYWTPEKRADDKWIKDLKKFAESCKPEYHRPVTELREKLARPKNAKRFELIKQRAKEQGLTKILEKIEVIEQVLAATK